jgi:hypothetical protein
VTKKVFFFEKKKQKTFTCCRGLAGDARKAIKVFWFAQGGLRLFSKQNMLPF